MVWSEQTLVQYRMHWCGKWLRRAKELEEAERLDAESRPSHVRDATSGKRILLTAEILDDMPCSMRIQRFWTCCVGVYRWLVVFLSATPSKSRSNLAC